MTTNEKEKIVIETGNYFAVYWKEEMNNQLLTAALQERLLHISHLEA